MLYQVATENMLLGKFLQDYKVYSKILKYSELVEVFGGEGGVKFSAVCKAKTTTHKGSDLAN